MGTTLPIFPSPYIALRNLAQAGQGTTWLIFNQDEGTQAVAKIAPPEVVRHEASMLTQVLHPLIPRLITTVMLASGEEALITEYMQGGTLEEFIGQHGAQPAILVRRWSLQLAEALHVAHSHQPPVIHRDIKPANVILRPTGQLALVDFGIARHFKPGQAKDTHAFGSPGYAAPEAYGKAQTDARSDLYSLAATMVYCLTGHDMSLTPLRPPDMSHIGDTALVELLHQSLQLYPDKRPQSAVEWIETLGGIAPPSGSSRILSPSLAPDGSILLPVPGGAFLSGPTRQPVFIADIAIGKEPVSIGQWRRYLVAGGSGPVVAPDLADELPVYGISWSDAERYCAFYGLRLPVAAEWEKAARGTDGRRYPWGDQWQPAEMVAQPGATNILPIAPRGLSPYGLVDLLGNIWEWTGDREKLAAIVCGGSYRNEGSLLACWTQQRFAADVSQPLVGFRVAR